MRPPHFVIAVATVVLSGCAWLGLSERLQGPEINSISLPAVTEQRADFVLAKNEGPIAVVPAESHALLRAAESKDSMLLLLIGASLLTIAAGMRRFGPALGDSADTCARHDSTSRASVTQTLSRPL